jgi:hypothetical protein
MIRASRTAGAGCGVAVPNEVSTAVVVVLATAGAILSSLPAQGCERLLTRGEALDMVLDRDLRYSAADLENINTGGQRRSMSDGPGPLPKEERQGLPIPGRRLPL